MEHLKMLLLKFFTITITIYVIFGAADYVSYDLLWIGLLTTLISYLIGDLLWLPRLIGAKAIVADFGLGIVSVWLFASLLINIDLPIVTLSIISALLFTAVEPFVHTYLLTLWRDQEQSNDEPTRTKEVIKRLGHHDTEDIPVIRNRYATEFAQELHIHDFDHDFYREQGHKEQRD